MARRSAPATRGSRVESLSQSRPLARAEAAEIRDKTERTIVLAAQLDPSLPLPLPLTLPRAWTARLDRAASPRRASKPMAGTAHGRQPARPTSPDLP